MSNVFIFHFLNMQQWLVKGLEWCTMIANHCYISGVGDNYCVCLVAQLYPTLCDLMNYSPPGSSSYEIFQARILEWVAILFSKGGLPNPEIKFTSLVSPALPGRFFTTEPPGKPCCVWCVGQREVRFILYCFILFYIVSFYS